MMRAPWANLIGVNVADHAKPHAMSDPDRCRNLAGASEKFDRASGSFHFGLDLPSAARASAAARAVGLRV
jgi:hypothetical protein